MRIKKIILTALTILQAAAGFAQSLRVEVPNLVAADEQFTVTFVFEGESKPSDFTWSQGDDFQLVWGPQQGSSTSIQIVNGKQSKSVQFTYTYILRPRSTGTFTIPAARATVKGKELHSEARSIEVVAGGTNSSAQKSQSQTQPSSRNSADISDEDIFLRMSLSRTNVVVGEPIVATVKLYQRVNITGFDDAKFPSFNGFWSQDITPQGDIQFTRENLDGKIFNSAVIRKYVIIPQQAGHLAIDPAELVCRIYVRVSSGGNSIFDGFFDDYTTVRKRVATSAARVNVSPLPSGAPASFGGGVGKFSMSASLSRDSLKAHDAASLLVTVSGTGNISLLEAPKISFPPDVEVYDTKVTDKIDKSTGGTSGSKTYEYPFIPRSHGDFVIEPVKYSYYDVNAGKYVTLESNPIPFHVERGAETDGGSPAGTVMASGVSKKGVANLANDIRFIHTKTPSFGQKGGFFVGSGLFWTIIALLVVAAVGIWVALRKMAARKADVAGAKTRKATKMAQKRLKLAGDFLSKNLYTAYYEELHKALLGFVSDKLNMPVAELSKDNIAGRLVEAGVEAALAQELVSAIDACEFARYSPSAGHDAMQADFDRAVNVISMIDSRMKKGAGAIKCSAMALIASLMLLPAAAHAQQADYADSLWTKACAEYAAGNWRTALDDFAAIDEAGLQSAELYFNMGNAAFKMEEYGKAVLYFERALKVDPSNSDARYNLEVCGRFVQDDIEAVPEFILKTWSRKLCYVADSNVWAVWTILFFALALAMILLFILGPGSGSRKAGFFSAIAALLLSAIALSFSLWQKSDYNKADSAIVMRPVSAVKSSPSTEGSADLFILHEGTKVKILDNVGGWTDIELADGRQGWLRSTDIEII